MSANACASFFKRGVTVIDIESYKEFVRAVELEELYLAEIQSRRKKDIEFPLRLGIKLDIGQPVLSRDRLSVEATFKLVADSRDRTTEQSDDPMFQMKMIWYVVYSFADKDPSDFATEIVKEFVKRNVPLNVWPYVRAAVTAATAQMGLPPLVLETYKVFG